MGEKEYQFGFGDANHPDRNTSLALEITYASADPMPHPGIQKYSLDGGYTISMHVKFDNRCLDNATNETTDLDWDAAGCSLLQYALREPEWEYFMCSSRSYSISREPFRQDPDNSHQFINLHELPGYSEFQESLDLNVCGTACRNAGYPLMELGRARHQSESWCKCFHVITHDGRLSPTNCDVDFWRAYANLDGNARLYSIRKSVWYFTANIVTLGIGVRNGKIYFGDNAHQDWDCSHLGPTEAPKVHPCSVTGAETLVTVNDDYNDGKFHHVVAEYSSSLKQMRLAVSRSDGSGYEVVNQAAPGAQSADRESLNTLYHADRAANPGNGYVFVDKGAWTVNAGGNAGRAGANMHSIRAYDIATMDQLLDETENPPPQPATHQAQCGCILRNPPSSPPSSPPPQGSPPGPPP